MGWLWAVSLPGLVCLLVVLAFVELVVRRRRGAPVSAVGFEQLGAAFEAGKADELEHRKAELMLRDDAEEGAPPRGPIDLDGGVARIKRPG
ncbi:hypothetical protein Lesp02_50510 [Lentzea sp. NBRC 105346]|uniref:DUF6191 domain-containing protein n=1 Tax=Lentzea sp. NBRC 105346 TaxID=3032205 RepID=UPI0024A36EF9|nr:DUF6191 domain-containing protein [Lentzea sp. NBRC 105346]GLZ32863.1 hypothetical protein Lesp02_50510 [Lentzea sp. NBRC 105346]